MDNIHSMSIGELILVVVSVVTNSTPPDAKWYVCLEEMSGGYYYILNDYVLNHSDFLKTTINYTMNNSFYSSAWYPNGKYRVRLFLKKPGQEYKLYLSKEYDYDHLFSIPQSTTSVSIVDVFVGDEYANYISRNISDGDRLSNTTTRRYVWTKISVNKKGIVYYNRSFLLNIDWPRDVPIDRVEHIHSGSVHSVSVDSGYYYYYLAFDFPGFVFPGNPLIQFNYTGFVGLFGNSYAFL